MTLSPTLPTGLDRLSARLVAPFERRLTAIPFVRRRLDSEYDKLLDGLESSLKPYRGSFPTYTRLPEAGIDRAEIRQQIGALASEEEAR